ncbi:hypothetical protein NX02_24110 [Sphingomonas sanxanigenens DSM 19645 = NX02]|uniref:Uncharacterized protein n=1 Tax=Sphingomonas sanxanigenens DSM 19645 = NX02 TaxID=1123269 RepID=W0AL64_9SPHN|nr:hypothetical protein NX02_24110 [Sphingomonas sanxanigenens DSM 19645 = NX02]
MLRPLAGGPRPGPLGDQRCFVAQPGPLADDRIPIPRGAGNPRGGGGDGGIRHAALGLLAGLRGQRLGQRDLGIACRHLGGGEVFGEPGAVLLGGGDARIERFGLIAQTLQRLGGVARKIAFARAIGVEPFGGGRQLGDAPVERAAFGAGGREDMARLGRGVARALRAGARGRQGLRGIELRGGRGALRLGGGDDQGFGALCLGTRGVGRGGGIAPARIDQPCLGDTDLVGELAILLRLPRLPA